jgi:hypothetical protein
MLRIFAIFIMALSLSPQLVADSPAITTDGASFSEPRNWVRLPVKKSKTKGFFISEDSDPKAPSAMILVDIGKPVESDARKTAEGLARNWGGKVLEETTELDGEVALRVHVANPGEGLRPKEGIIVFRDNRVYLVMAGSVPGIDVIDELEQVRQSWKWIDR